jgi:hypothetical protein
VLAEGSRAREQEDGFDIQGLAINRTINLYDRLFKQKPITAQRAQAHHKSMRRATEVPPPATRGRRNFFCNFV